MPEKEAARGSRGGGQRPWLATGTLGKAVRVRSANAPEDMLQSEPPGDLEATQATKCDSTFPWRRTRGGQLQEPSPSGALGPRHP